MNQKQRKTMKKLQMALWRVLDYTSAPLRGAVKHPPNNSLNSDKKVNSKPSETGRSPLNRLANRPVVLRTAAYFEFLLLFFLPSVFLFRFVSDGVSLRRSFYYRKNHFSVLFEYDFTPWKRQKSTQNLLQPIHAFLSAYDIIVDVTTTSHFGTFRSHRCPVFAKFPWYSCNR